MTQYAQIVFLQGDEAQELIEILINQGEHECLEYLKQWDCGTESECNLTDYNSAGTNDREFISGDYVVNYNIPLDYIGLQRIVTDND